MQIEPSLGLPASPVMNASPSHPWYIGHHTANPYFAFTDAVNARRPIVLLSSGQACVWYRLTLASKDGAWIVREDQDSCATVLARLAVLGATYRLGAPLDPRWLSAGWSAHFEAMGPANERLRFDFVSRPPRIDASLLADLWRRVERGGPAVVTPEALIRLKRTMRMKDYPFIGALALACEDPADQLRWSIDAAHVCALLRDHPSLAARLAELRPALHGMPHDEDAVATAIDAEIRAARRADERRMAAYAQAMAPWAERFRGLDRDLPLPAAHAQVCAAAAGVLPETAP